MFHTGFLVCVLFTYLLFIDLFLFFCLLVNFCGLELKCHSVFAKCLAAYVHFWIALTERWSRCLNSNFFLTLFKRQCLFTSCLKWIWDWCDGLCEPIRPTSNKLHRRRGQCVYLLLDCVRLFSVFFLLWWHKTGQTNGEQGTQKSPTLSPG